MQAVLMFRWKRDRRQSSPEERAEFDRQRSASEDASQDERRDVERRLELLEAEVSLLAGHSRVEKRRTGE